MIDDQRWSSAARGFSLSLFCAAALWLAALSWPVALAHAAPPLQDATPTPVAPVTASNEACLACHANASTWVWFKVLHRQAWLGARSVRGLRACAAKDDWLAGARADRMESWPMPCCWWPLLVQVWSCQRASLP